MTLEASLVGTAKGYGELFSQGNVAAWAAAAALGSPSAHGWLLDSSVLEGTQIQAGAWTPSLRMSLSGFSAPITALTVYPTHGTSATLSSASTLVTATGATLVGSTVPIGTSTGYGELNSSLYTSWPALGAIGNPDGQGWLWDVSTLSGNQIISGNWTPTVMLATSVGSVTADLYVRAYKYNSGTYTQIGTTMSLTSQTVNTTPTSFVFAATSQAAMSFGTGDKLYLDVWVNIKTNSTGSGAATMRIRIANSTTLGNTSTQIVTPGYQSTNASITADLYMRAYVYNGGNYTPIGTFSLLAQTITSVITTYSLIAVIESAITVNSGDKLYLDAWADITVNTIGSATLQLTVSLSTSGSAGVAHDIEMDTPGYLGTGSSSGGPPPPTLPPPPPTAPARSVYINKQPYTALAGSLTITNAIGRRSTASVQLLTDTSVHFQQYQTIAIYDQFGKRIFNGYVTQPKEQKPGFALKLTHTITCCDQHFLADKRIIAASYTNRTVGEIVLDIVANILSQEGVTVGAVYDGMPPALTLYPNTTLYPAGNVGLIPSAVFAYCTVAQALDALEKEASSAGIPYLWQIDQNLQLWFVPYTAIQNDRKIDGTEIDTQRMPASVIRANPTYRNTQYIVGGVAQTVQQTENRVGDGNTRSWTMGYDMSSTAPVVNVNTGSGYAGQTVGLKGTTGSQFYWAQGDPVITQDSGQPVLRGSPQFDLLQVIYTGQYETAIVDQDAGQISRQASIDGTSGIIEEVEQNNTITSLTSGLNVASQLLTRYAMQGTILESTTLHYGYEPGQLVPVDLPWFGLHNVDMLIEEVSASDSHDGYNIWYTVKSVLGPYDTTWVDFFSTLLAFNQPANSIAVGLSKSVALLVNFVATLTPTATLNIGASGTGCPIPSNTLYPGNTLYGC